MGRICLDSIMDIHLETRYIVAKREIMGYTQDKQKLQPLCIVCGRVYIYICRSPMFLIVRTGPHHDFPRIKE